MKLHSLAVGSDDRNRCLLSAFRSKTSRNQPSNTQFIFGPSAWLRSLIRPAPGRAVAYVDWSQQELAIAARLSGDLAMQTAYQSGDFYMTFAKLANAVPQDATKKTHGTIRDKFKIVSLGVLYGLGAESLARKLAVPKVEGRWLLRSHKEAISYVLGMVRPYRDARHVAWSAGIPVRLASPGWFRCQPSIPQKFPDAGRRRGHDAPGLLPGDENGGSRFAALFTTRCWSKETWTRSRR